MKLFLASYRFGAHADEFVALTSGPGSIAVVADAADGWPPAARRSAVESEFRGLRDLGYDPFELDLRDFRDGSNDVGAVLDSVDTVWLRGGNTFVLRAQLSRSGADVAITSRVRDGSLVYAGYSAGACVAAPSLHGLEAADDPADVDRLDGSEVLWDGLNLVDIAFVPHYESVLDEDAVNEKIVARYQRENVRHTTLRDDQVYIVDGHRRERI